MSLLSGANPQGLDDYDEPRFKAMMDEWARAVSTFLGAKPPGRFG